VLVIISLGYNALKAHPVSISWISGRISDSEIVMNYRILAEDMTLYYHPSHNDQFDYSIKELEKLASSHMAFFEQFFIVNVDGNSARLLKSKLVGSTLPDKKYVNVMDLMKYEVHYQFIYEINPDWKELSFRHLFQEIKNDLPTVCYLNLTDKKLVLVENQEITSEPLVVLRDNPVKPANPSLQTSSFFTLGLKGVYHELTLPSESLMSLMGISDREDINNISIERYLQSSQNRIIADSTDLKVICAEYILLTDMENSKVYMNLYYPYLKLPERIELTWRDYDWNLRWFDSRIKTMRSSIYHRFTRYQPKILLEGVYEIKKKD
jgi:hypothetical protein